LDIIKFQSLKSDTGHITGETPTIQFSIGDKYCCHPLMNNT